MARARNIKPGFFTNGDLIECSPLARLLFIGLWTEADRRGVLEDRPKTLKLKLLPGDDCDADELLNELASHGFIERYEADGARCIYIVKFGAHQTPHQKEPANEMPLPEESDARPVHVQDMSDTSTEQDEISTASRAPALTVSTTESISSTPTPTGVASTQLLEERFDRFWHAYPLKKSKEGARKWWAKNKPTEELLAEMLAALEWQRRQHNWTKDNGEYIPHAPTWLNGKKWTDEPANIRPLPEQPGSESWRERKAQF